MTLQFQKLCSYQLHTADNEIESHLYFARYGFHQALGFCFMWCVALPYSQKVFGRGHDAVLQQEDHGHGILIAFYASKSLITCQYELRKCLIPMKSALSQMPRFFHHCFLALCSFLAKGCLFPFIL